MTQLIEDFVGNKSNGCKTSHGCKSRFAACRAIEDQIFVVIYEPIDPSDCVCSDLLGIGDHLFQALVHLDAGFFAQNVAEAEHVDGLKVFVLKTVFT